MWMWMWMDVARHGYLTFESFDESRGSRLGLTLTQTLKLTLDLALGTFRFTTTG